MKLIIRQEAKYDYDESKPIFENKDDALRAYKRFPPKIEVILPKEVKLKSYRREN